MKKFLNNTLLGGVLFLIPLVIIVIVLHKAYDIMLLLAKPVQQIIPADAVVGVPVIDVLAILIMIVICLLVGIFAKSKPAMAFYAKIDGIWLELLPGYAWTKTVIGNLTGAENLAQFKPVIVRLDDQRQLAFELERAADGSVVVFFPGSPDPRSGAVAYVSPDRIEETSATFLEINKSLKHMGRGAAGFLDQ